jgi:LmbE family N-acetylglucosaminyl deacetylase
MLVIAPHQDDEIIGCGGAILLQRKVSKRIHLTFVFEGGDEYKALGYSRYEDLVMEREKESSSVSSILSIDSPVFLRSKKNRTTVHDLAEKLYTIICKVKPDVIFAPFFLDSNNEHRITAHALATALEKTPKNQKILCYEVWGLCIANVTVKIDSVINEKRDLLEIYQSQLKGTDYTNSVIGLNMYHSRLLGAGEGKFAEHYFEIPAVDYCTLIKKINRAV